MNILIVDDSGPLRTRLAELIREIRGITKIQEAENGRQALDAISEHHPDVVILDIRMPNGNGVEVLKKVRENLSSIVFIMFTNYPHDPYKKKCMELGADYFLEKSSETERILQIINELAETKSKSGETK